MRQEFKYVILKSDTELFKKYLNLFCKPDHHSINGPYKLESEYYDTLDMDAFYEKEEGFYRRSKFRIRKYSNKYQLEIKERRGNDGWKTNIPLKTVDNELECTDKKLKVIWDLFLTKTRMKQLRNTVTTTYYREGFFSFGDSRITIDSEIKYNTPNQEKKYILAPDKCILEVKFKNSYIPKEVQELITRFNLKRIAFSKYAEAIKLWH